MFVEPEEQLARAAQFRYLVKTETPSDRAVR
jgi:hypothetical protein